METRVEAIYELLDEIWALIHAIRLLLEIKEEAGIDVNPHALILYGRMITANSIQLNKALQDQCNP